MLYFNQMLRKKHFVYWILTIVWSLVMGHWSLAYADYVPGQIMVKFKPGIVKIPKGLRVAGVKAASVLAASVRDLNAKYGIVEIEQLYQKALEIRPDWTHLEDDFVLYFPEDKNVLKVVGDYRDDPNVASASPCSIVRAFNLTPNDPLFISSQYGLSNIKAPQAWDSTTGESSVVIAVLDTGIKADHEDFAGRIDSRGGWDFVNDDNNPADDYGHGTAVSGVAAAATNNNKGVAGVDWGAKIFPVKVLNSLGIGYMPDILQGIQYASAAGVEIINMSFGQYQHDPSLQSACTDAYNNGIVLVAAAGNGNVEWETYPAYYSGVLAVVAVDQGDIRSYWGGFDPETFRPQASNYGTWVDVSAPGSVIWTTILSTAGRSGLYYAWNGTSFASPFVAGLAGLIKALRPTLSNQEIMDTIIDTADDIDGLNAPEFAGKLGSGRINAYRAVGGVIGRITSPAENAYIKGSVDICGTAAGWDFSDYRLEVLKNGALALTLEASLISIESGVLGTWDTLGYNAEYTLRLRVFSNSSDTEEVEVVVFVDNVTPEAEISSPSQGSSVEGRVTIVGTAEDEFFERYLLEYGEGASPSQFERIRESYNPVDGGTLADWETAGLEGIYTIRLKVYDKADTSATQSIQVNISSLPPTKEAEPQSGLPLTFALPNPFDRNNTSEITFNYVLEGNFNTKIYLFDLSGNLIWQKSYLAGENGAKSGENNPPWNGTDLYGRRVPNGVYIYQVVADRKVIAKGKVIVLN